MKTFLGNLLLFSMISKLRESRNYAKGAEGLRQSELYLDPLPRPVYISREGEKIDFARGVSLESEMEAEQHFESLGDG